MLGLSRRLPLSHSHPPLKGGGRWDKWAAHWNKWDKWDKTTPQSRIPSLVSGANLGTKWHIHVSQLFNVWDKWVGRPFVEKCSDLGVCTRFRFLYQLINVAHDPVSVERASGNRTQGWGPVPSNKPVNEPAYSNHRCHTQGCWKWVPPTRHCGDLKFFFRGGGCLVRHFERWWDSLFLGLRGRFFGLSLVAFSVLKPKKAYFRARLGQKMNGEPQTRKAQQTPQTEFRNQAFHSDILPTHTHPVAQLFTPAINGSQISTLADQPSAKPHSCIWFGEAPCLQTPHKTQQISPQLARGYT